MFNMPHRDPIATARPVKARGMLLLIVLAMDWGVPSAPWIREVYARMGDSPARRMNRAPITSASPMAARDLPISAVFLLHIHFMSIYLLFLSCHEQADFFLCIFPIGKLGADLPFIKHGDAVAEVHDFRQFR